MTTSRGVVRATTRTLAERIWSFVDVLALDVKTRPSSATVRVLIGDGREGMMVGSVPRLKLTQEQKRHLTRTRLLDAATVLFATNGYTNTTAEKIAEAAGCSRATFYLHFKSKSTAMVGLLERTWPDFVVRTAETIAAIDTGISTSQLRDGLEDQLALWLLQPGAITALNVAILIDPVVAEWMDRNTAIAIDMLARASEGPAAPARERRRAQLAVLSHMTLAGFDLVEHRRHEPDSWRAEVVDYLAGLWANVLRGD